METKDKIKKYLYVIIKLSNSLTLCQYQYNYYIITLLHTLIHNLISETKTLSRYINR